jgi:hypothetical protein
MSEALLNRLLRPTHTAPAQAALSRREYRISYPTAPWRVEVVEEIAERESPRFHHRSVDGGLLHLRDGARGTAPDVVVIEKRFAGLTWSVTQGGELYLFYTTHQPDKGNFVPHPG